ncbi:MAG: hypothetical protein L0Z54_00170 [Thermoplasmata archaeon]|nr:hypothetical protein [Thermoplasmata archaeon]
MTNVVKERVQLRAMKCPRCGGPLVRSKSFATGGNFFSWQKPWSSWLKMTVPIWMWGCMKCGKVEFFLKEGREVHHEFEALVANGTIILEFIDQADDGGDTAETGKDRRGGFQRIK